MAMAATMPQRAGDEQQLGRANFAKSVLNILEDSAAQRNHLHDAQRAVLNTKRSTFTLSVRGQ